MTLQGRVVQSQVQLVSGSGDDLKRDLVRVKEARLNPNPSPSKRREEGRQTVSVTLTLSLTLTLIGGAGRGYQIFERQNRYVRGPVPVLTLTVLGGKRKT